MQEMSNILVLDAEGKKIGEMPELSARRIADEQGLDLVYIASSGSTKVAKIVDEGKYKYELEKAKKHKQKHNKPQQTKEVRFHINTEQHDINVKISHIERFLQKGYLVVVAVDMKSRDKAHPELAREKLANIIQHFGERIKCDNMKSTSDSVSVVVSNSK